jgi:hypothetical protein
VLSRINFLLFNKLEECSKSRDFFFFQLRQRRAKIKSDSDCLHNEKLLHSTSPNEKKSRAKKNNQNSKSAEIIPKRFGRNLKQSCRCAASPIGSGFPDPVDGPGSGARRPAHVA